MSEDLTLVHRLENRIDKIRDCRKQANAKKLGALDRIKFVRECME